MSEKKLRLRKLIEHWIEHNDDHVKRFREAASEAKEIELKKVADILIEASRRSKEVSEILEKSLNEFDR